MRTVNKVLLCTFAISVGLSVFPSTSKAATWGVQYNGWGMTVYPCIYGGSTWVQDPIFTVYTITSPSDWPAYSSFGQELWFMGQLIYSDDKTNTPTGENLTFTTSVPVYGMPNWIASVGSMHWGIYNGVYTSATDDASGVSSPCQ